MKIVFKIIGLFSMAILFLGCIKEEPFVTDGMRPIYIPADNFDLIRAGPPRESLNQGKVIVYEDFILISENLVGIHVIDNSNPNNPVKIAFWEIPGNSNFTIDNDILYADNGLYLLVIEVVDYQTIVFQSIVPDHLTSTEEFEVFPPNHNGWFECAQLGRGIVVGWETAEISDPKCFR